MLVRSNFRLSVYSLISDLDAVKIESPSFVPFFTSQTFSTTPSTLSFFLKTPLYPQRFSKTAHPYGNDCQNDYFLIKPAATNNKNIKKRSVSTERWFGAHSARRFKKPPIHPLGKQKAHLAIRSLLFGVDSLNSERASLLAKAKCGHRKVVRHAKRVAV